MCPDEGPTSGLGFEVSHWEILKRVVIGRKVKSGCQVVIEGCVSANQDGAIYSKMVVLSLLVHFAKGGTEGLHLPLGMDGLRISEDVR